MEKQNIHYLGGKAKAKKINDLYNINPNKCLYCGEPILRKKEKTLSDVKKKKFCNHYCSAKFFNSLRKKPKICKICNKEINNGRKRCDKCIDKYVSKIGCVVKKDTTHAKIRGHARYIFNKHNKKVECENCGFNHFTEICHIKPVSEFKDTDTLSVINDISNLVQLCPNCHWDFDHSIITKL